LKSFETYKEEVILDYKAKKEKGSLPFNLQNPTPANLKKECISIFPARHLKAHEFTFPALFGNKDNVADYLKAFESSDPDIFRPLNTFLRRDTEVGTNDRNIYLLAWLIDFEPEVSAFKPEPAPTNPPRTTSASPFDFKKLIVPLVIALVTGVIIYIGSTGSKDECMYWDGDQYNSIACEQRADGIVIVDLDTFRLAHLKRIKNPGSIQLRDIGKVHYSTVGGVPEFYTMGGENPTDTAKRLLPLSRGMYEKYINKK